MDGKGGGAGAPALRRIVFGALLAAGLLAAACGSGSGVRDAPMPTPTTPSINVVVGAFAFDTHGCAACHGNRAQGSVAPRLGKIDRKALERIVRTGPGLMPTYSEATLPDDQLEQIYLFLQVVGEDR